MTSIYDDGPLWPPISDTIIRNREAWIAADEILRSYENSSGPTFDHYPLQSAVATTGISSSGPNTGSNQPRMGEGDELCLRRSKSATEAWVDCLDTTYEAWKRLKTLWLCGSLQRPEPLYLYMSSLVDCMSKNTEVMIRLIHHTQSLLHEQSRVQRDRTKTQDPRAVKDTLLEQIIVDTGVKIEHVIVSPNKFKKEQDLQLLTRATDVLATVLLDRVGPDEYGSVWRIDDERYERMHKTDAPPHPGLTANARLYRVPPLTEGERTRLYRRLETAATRCELTFAPEIVPTAHPRMENLAFITKYLGRRIPASIRSHEPAGQPSTASEEQLKGSPVLPRPSETASSA